MGKYTSALMLHSNILEWSKKEGLWGKRKLSKMSIPKMMGKKLKGASCLLDAKMSCTDSKMHMLERKLK